MAIDDLVVGDRVGIYRKSKRVHTGALLKKINANDEMTWGHKMKPYWVLTIEVDGLGPRRWQDGMFRAKDLRKFGFVDVRSEDGD